MNEYRPKWLQLVTDDERFSTEARLVAKSLAAGMTGLAPVSYMTWPSLARYSGLSPKVVHDSVNALRAVGYVGDYWRSLPGRSNGFKILIPSEPE